MKFFPESTKNDRPIVKIIRFAALISIFIIAGVMFARNNEKAVRTITAKSAIWDQSKTLNEAQKKSLHRLHREFKSRFGIKLKINITTTDPTPPKIDTQTLFIGLCLAPRKVTVIFPPLVQAAFGKQFCTEFQRDYFKNSWENNAWVLRLGQALTLISDKLMAMEHDTIK